MSVLGWLLVLDGTAFVLIGVVVLVAPSPQPALARPLDPGALVPFADTRRLLASQFVGVGLLALVLGAVVREPDALRLAALARVITLVVVAAINVAQLRDGAWKPEPLRGLLAAFAILAAAYAVLGVAA